MKRYNPKDLEPKWQKKWASRELYKAKDFDAKRPKFVMLTEFPYPSGDGLHIGHVREYSLADIIARHKRMNGYNVLYPMGYDAFGLPTENFAIKHKIAPQLATERNTANFQKQFDSLGYSIDWSRSFKTTDPSYYKWTQWLFLQFYKHGLAYQDEIDINWCPHCKTGLANEEVVNGRHERCDTLVEKKTLKQWLLRITKYADRLIDGLQSVDYPSRIADQQVNWIGRSTGAEVDFAVDGRKEKITVFTTRPDTLFGATFMVLAPEHTLVEKITTDEQRSHVNAYIKAAQAKSDIERQNTDRDKTGVFTGAYGVNPVNGQKVPIWIADYVLTGYGTGAIMAVPAHDERDFAFAKKYDLPVEYVIAPEFIDDITPTRPGAKLVERTVAQCIVKHPSEAKYLLLKRISWEKPNYSFVTGGADKGEDLAQAAIRELREETGYFNTGDVHQIGGPFFTEFYHGHKKINRRAKVYTFVTQLTNLDRVKVSAEEQAINEPEWFDESEITEKVHGEGPKEWFEKHLYGDTAVAGEGVLVNSGTYDDLPSAEARDKIVKDLAKKGLAKERVNYRLRDWIFSRQHYWGEPIPIIHCDKCGAVPVPEKDLPVELPKVEHYEPTDTGESPLAAISDWVNVKCPKCDGPAKRETDTMPNWAGSSWYYLRYYDAHNDKAFADPKKLEYWGEVDLYLGGMEHTTLHLLYSRFWHQFFYDQGLVPTPEPYHARRGQGIILAADGSKMSKSKGNVVNPTEVIDDGYGADALRLAIAFLAPYDQTTPWSPEAVAGTFRFVQRVWTLVHEYLAAQTGDEHDTELLRATHQAIQKVTADVVDMNFNTAVSALMELVNQLYKRKAAYGFAAGTDWQFALMALVQMLAPFAPHVSEELWQTLGCKGSVHVSQWPTWDAQYLVRETATIVVQVNGKVRAQLELPIESDQSAVEKAAKANPKVAGYLKDQQIIKTIYVPGKLISFVVRPTTK